MKISEFSCPFSSASQSKGFGKMDDQNDPVTMLLRLKDVRKTAHNWRVFQSGAAPGRIVVPSEVAIRDTRQIPFEVDPPEHKDYRLLLEPWFKRPLQDAYQARLIELVDMAIDTALSADSVDIVSEFSLPLQSRALTLLLNTPYEESDVWIGWGTHVFRSEGESLDGAKANILYDYLDEQIERASQTGGEDLYSVLLNCEVAGKKLSKEEVKGVMILTFAGGRDTVINALTNTLAYFSEHPQWLAKLKEQPELVNTAVEELIRYFSPLTHMGRVLTQDATVAEQDLKADTRVSLCWAAANRDSRTFENPHEVILDRKVNPHVGFGFSHHNCLGATHARQILRTLLSRLPHKVSAIKALEYDENIESLGEFSRKVGFNKFIASFEAL